MRYSMNIFWSEDDGVFVGVVPELPGCMAHGDTYAQAATALSEAAALWVSVAEEAGRAMPAPATGPLLASWFAGAEAAEPPAGEGMDDEPFQELLQGVEELNAPLQEEIVPGVRVMNAEESRRRSWNYRMVERSGYIQVHEVYYEGGRPVAVTENATAIGGETAEELRRDLQRYAAALSEPVLKWEEIGDDTGEA